LASKDIDRIPGGTKPPFLGSSLFPVGRGGLDGWRMMATDDTGTDLWTVAGAWEELERGGVAV
jgi:hypothetical protein